jgi:hypothetical protein
MEHWHNFGGDDERQIVPSPHGVPGGHLRVSERECRPTGRDDSVASGRLSMHPSTQETR